jgi:transposase
LVLGLSVTADGAVPLVHQVYDGNQTDDRLHGSNHQRLRRLLKKSDFIYVADCKLATDSNLGKIVACGGRFISVMPRSWKEDAWFREEVKQGKIKWQRILSRKNNRKPDSKVDHYELADGSYQTSQGYLLHWIRSSQKAEQDSQTRQRHIDDALVGLSEVQSGLNQYRLKSYKNIEKKITQVLKENGSEAWIVYEINEHKGYKVSHQGVGRPRKGDNGEKLETKYFSISFAVNQEAVKWEAMTDGVFPLITNAEQMSAKRVLEVYKFQPFLEKRHSQLKSQQEISPVYLKKGERVVAFLHVHIMALMVATLIERTLRKAMQKKDIEVLPLYPEGRACRHPTIFDLVRLFRGVERYEVEDRQGVTIFPAELTDTQKQVLKLLEVPLSFYH